MKVGDIVKMTKADGTPATPEDFDRILNLPRPEAERAISEMFPGNAFTAFMHYNQIAQAKSQFLAKSAKLREAVTARAKKQEQESKAMQERLANEFEKRKKGVAEKFAGIFGTEGLDKDLQDAVSRGYKVADLAIHGSDDMNPEQFQNLMAESYHRIAHFDRMAMQTFRLQKEVESLKAKLQSFEKSEPPTGESPAAAGDAVSKGGSLLERTLATLGSKRS